MTTEGQIETVECHVRDALTRGARVLCVATGAGRHRR
jgi:hypothetical protein